MRAFAKVIVEEKHGQWSAFLMDLPQVAFGGEYPSDAIWRLLRHIGEHCFDVDEIAAVEDATRDGHLEFLIPLVGRRRIPAPSFN